RGRIRSRIHGAQGADGGREASPRERGTAVAGRPQSGRAGDGPAFASWANPGPGKDALQPGAGGRAVSVTSGPIQSEVNPPASAEGRAVDHGSCVPDRRWCV